MQTMDVVLNDLRNHDQIGVRKCSFAARLPDGADETLRSKQIIVAEFENLPASDKDHMAFH